MGAWARELAAISGLKALRDDAEVRGHAGALVGERGGLVVVVTSLLVPGKSPRPTMEIALRGVLRDGVTCSDAEEPAGDGWIRWQVVLLADVAHAPTLGPTAFQRGGAVVELLSPARRESPEPARALAEIDERIREARELLDPLPERCENCGEPTADLAMLDSLPVRACARCVASARAAADEANRWAGRLPAAAAPIAVLAPVLGAPLASLIPLGLSEAAQRWAAPASQLAEGMVTVAWLMLAVLPAAAAIALGVRLPRRVAVRPSGTETVGLVLGLLLALPATMLVLAGLVGALAVLENWASPACLGAAITVGAAICVVHARSQPSNHEALMPIALETLVERSSG